MRASVAGTRGLLPTRLPERHDRAVFQRFSLASRQNSGTRRTDPGALYFPCHASTRHVNSYCS